MTPRKEIVIGLTELRLVCVACEHCKTRVVLDLEEPSGFQEKHGFFAPAVCPTCQKSYDLTLTEGLGMLQRAYTRLAPISQRFTFLVESSMEPQ